MTFSLPLLAWLFGGPVAAAGDLERPGVAVVEVEALRLGHLWVQRTELTRGDYLAVFPGGGPARWAFDPEPAGDEPRLKLPATHLSWTEAVAFANALSTAQGLAPAYELDGDELKILRGRPGWRLPTGAEWDRAASRLGDGRAPEAPPRRVLPVCGGGEAADQLCDTHGNAWEWVEEREPADEDDPFIDAWARDCGGFESEGPISEPCTLHATSALREVGFRLVRRAR